MSQQEGLTPRTAFGEQPVASEEAASWGPPDSPGYVETSSRIADVAVTEEGVAPPPVLQLSED
jgi:hypothetical protein